VKHSHSSPPFLREGGGKSASVYANKRMVLTLGTRADFGIVLSLRCLAGVGVGARRHGVPNAAHAIGRTPFSTNNFSK